MKFGEAEGTDHVRITLDSGKQIVAEKALYSIGRTGNTNRLNLQNAGIAPDDRGRIEVNANYQTKEPHIYAVGDVIGFPSLASTSMEQGRLAACHAVGIKTSSVPELFPYGIYTIPEISMVGRNEEELTQEGVPYEVGKARYREIARGQILGDTTGLLKLLFHIETRRTAGSAHHRRGRQRTGSHRPGGAGVRWHGRLLRQYGVQLPDAGGMLQDGRV